jgi:hypothetical protein
VIPVTFALVHGASHGAWCYGPLIDALAAVGHRGIAMDTPVEDRAAGLRQHASAVAAAVHGVTDRLVVVGHSASGAFLPLAATAAGAQAMIFLCAVLPVEGESANAQRAADPTMITMPPASLRRDAEGRTLAPEAVGRDYYYDDCDPAVAAWAVGQLRAQAPTVMNEVFPIGGWPGLPARYILCTGDRCINPAWSRRASLARLGVPAIELPGGHSPFLSRPAVLAAALVDAADAMLG